MISEGNIILIGMPGCGKTSFGRELAAALGRDFYDADAVLEEREGRTIKSFFAESEEAFRVAETRTLRYLAQLEGVVIATGGGAVTRSENMELLSATGRIIFIDREPAKIIDEIDATSRPLLTADKQRIFRLYGERIELYRRYADMTVAYDDAAEETLAALIKCSREDEK